MVENDGAKIPLDYQTRDTMAVDTVDKKAVPNDSNIRNTEHVKLEAEPVSERTVGEDVGGLKTTMVPVVITPGGVAPADPNWDLFPKKCSGRNG